MKTLSLMLLAVFFDIAGYQTSIWLRNWGMVLGAIDTEQKLRNF